MANFDLARVRPEQYNFDDVADCLDFKIMAEELMALVKTNPAACDGHQDDIDSFTKMLVDSDSAWQLAVNVVPEFRYPQDYDAETEATVLNAILRTVKHKRPPAPYGDDNAAIEKVLRQQDRDAIEYIGTLGEGHDRATAQKKAEVDHL